MWCDKNKRTPRKQKRGSRKTKFLRPSRMSGLGRNLDVSLSSNRKNAGTFSLVILAYIITPGRRKSRESYHELCNMLRTKYSGVHGTWFKESSKIVVSPLRSWKPSKTTIPTHKFYRTKKYQFDANRRVRGTCVSLIRISATTSMRISPSCSCMACDLANSRGTTPLIRTYTGQCFMLDTTTTLPA